MVRLKTTSEVWIALTDAYARESQEREFYLRSQLQIFKKGSSSISNYIRKFKGLCDDLAAIGKPIED